MDIYKLKWKLDFRKKQLKGFFTLCKYIYLHKFDLEGDDQFYYHMQRQLLKDLIKASPEQEYLEEHGLLPDEPEPEPEPEPEKEPGLVRELGFMELVIYHTTLNDDLYTAVSVKEYEDQTVLEAQIVDGKTLEVREETVRMPHQAGERYDPFTLDCEAWRWDRVDGRMRLCPLVEETAGDLAAAKPVRHLFDLVLRVDKALAEERLSPLCLEYAFHCDENGYSWCIPDYSYCTVVHELELAADGDTFIENLKNLELHCRRYFVENQLEQYKAEIKLGYKFSS